MDYKYSTQKVNSAGELTSGMNEADPLNPITVPGKLAGDTVGKMSA